LSKIVLYCLVFLVGSCAQITSLNLQKHQFGKIPTKIIWFQIAGFSTEHLAMLKFTGPGTSKTTAFESSLCVGQAWDYNLYKLRPSAEESFMAQLTGKQNIKNKCEDYKQKPIWKYLTSKGYRVGVFEGESYKKQSLLKSSSCKGEGEDYLNNLSFWKMSKNLASAKTFHVNEKQNYEAGKIYYDKSCNSGECFTNFSRNVESTFRTFSKTAKNYLYLVRNFQYRNHIQASRFKSAKAELIEINSAVKAMQKYASQHSDVLVLVTTADVKELNFPSRGSEWRKYEKYTKNLKKTNTKLISNVYASGARAENFCGIYKQSSILSRIFSGAKQQGLEFSIINPFE
jgi:hypothetical protein